MRSARSLLNLLLLVAGLLLPTAVAAAQNRTGYRLSGNRESLWVVREQKLAKTYDIVAKPIGQEWKWIARDVRGRPSGLATMERRLEVMFPDLSMLIYSLDTPEPIVGRSPDDPGWPAKVVPVAMAAGALIDANSARVVALVLVPRTVVSTRPVTAPPDANDPNAGEELGALRRTAYQPVLFVSDGVNWSRLAALPMRLGRKDPPVGLCLSDGKVYVYIDRRGEELAIGEAGPIAPGQAGVLEFDPADSEIKLPPGSGTADADPPIDARTDGPRKPAATRPYRMRAGLWTLVVGDEQIPRGRVFGMIGLDNHVILAVHADDNEPATQPGELKRLTTTQAVPAETRPIVLVTCEPARRTVSRQPVRKPGSQPLTLGDGQPLAATRLGDRVMLLWREGDEPNAPLRLGDSGPNGQLVAVKKLAIFSEPPAEAGSEQVIEYLMWAVLIAMVVPLFILRPRGPQKPFVLPPFVRPGNLFKRAAAGLIDLLPFTTGATLIVGVDQNMLEDPWSLARMETLPVEYAWAMVAALGLYVLYCMVMETKFGATVGKMVTGLRVVGNEAEEPDLRAIFLRNLVKIVELITFLMPLLFILPLVTPFRQRLGDMLARTAVVEKASLGGHTPPPMTMPDEMRRDESDEPDDGDAEER